MKRLILPLSLAALMALGLILNLPQQEPISLQEAMGIAQSFYPGANVIKTELVQTAQPPYYLIGLDNGKSIYINAVSKEILQIIGGASVFYSNAVNIPIPPSQGEVIAPLVGEPGALVDYARAIQIAQSFFPNTAAVKVEFKSGGEHGYASAWEVKLDNGYEVYVNAVDGSIIQSYHHGGEYYSGDGRYYYDEWYSHQHND